jgi:gamma-glutamyl hercynylcysteine S-oxide synthase
VSGTSMQSTEKEAMTASVPVERAELAKAMIAQREYTLAMYADLPEAYWEPRNFPYRTIVNPALWELAHIAWFQEFFALRWRADDQTCSRTPSSLDVADELFDSRIVPHDARWQLTYPSKARCMDYMQRVLDHAAASLHKDGGVDRYGFQLALVHEDMHAEALAMTLTTLGLSLPDVTPAQRALGANALSSPEILCAGGAMQLGGDASSRSFVFDNEKPSHLIQVAPFTIDARVVSAAEFAEFVSSAAYRDSRFWSDRGNAWRERRSLATLAGRSADFAAMHVSFYEAEAYCRWKNRRLPTESEWEFSAVTSKEFGTSTGHVWEWTASAFEPYPGFETERYGEYSEPWFASHGLEHRVLKGGSFVTHPRLKYPQYRNFYTPDRTDMFCGFRTCAIA